MELSPISLPIGNIDLLAKENKTAFLCSRNVPEACLPGIATWLDSLSAETDCVMCGNMQKIENDVLYGLLKRNIPTVLVLDGPFPEMWPISLVEAVGDQRLLVVTTSDFLLPWVDKYGMADARNRYMVANAAKVVLGFCRPGGQLAGQLRGVNVEVQELTPYSPQLEAGGQKSK
ncbi:hypothetical protein NP234_24340 [Salmonella enterica]|nr:hypothetical protein [Salmonella enterica]